MSNPPYDSDAPAAPEPDARGLYVVVALLGSERAAAEEAAENYGGGLREHAGDTETRFALFRGVEAASVFLAEILQLPRIQAGVVVGEVNPGSGRNIFLDAAAHLAGQARAGQVLLTEQVMDLLKSLDLEDFETQYLGPREVSGLSRSPGVFRAGTVGNGGNPSSAGKSGQMELLLMQAREEARRKREASRRNMGLAIGCAMLFFAVVVTILVLWAVFGGVLDQFMGDKPSQQGYPLFNQRDAPSAAAFPFHEPPISPWNRQPPEPLSCATTL